MLEETWEKGARNSSIFPTTPFSPWSVALTAGVFFLTQRSVRPPYGLLIHAQRERLFSLHTQAGILTQKSDMFFFPVYFAVGYKIFHHAQAIEVNFPCESRAHCFVLGLLSSPRVFVLAVVSNCVLGHWVFVVSRFSTVVYV